MPLIGAEDRETLQDLFAERMRDEVTITYFMKPALKLFIPGQEPDLSRETQQLLEELAELSDKISLEVNDITKDVEAAQEHGITRIPAFVLKGHTQGSVRFFGIPSGYEFATLIEDLIDVSTGETDLSKDSRASLEKVDRDLHIQVFVTPT